MRGGGSFDQFAARGLAQQLVCQRRWMTVDHVEQLLRIRRARKLLESIDEEDAVFSRNLRYLPAERIRVYSGRKAPFVNHQDLRPFRNYHDEEARSRRVNLLRHFPKQGIGDGEALTPRR